MSLNSHFLQRNIIRSLDRIFLLQLVSDEKCVA